MFHIRVILVYYALNRLFYELAPIQTWSHNGKHGKITIHDGAHAAWFWGRVTMIAVGRSGMASLQRSYGNLARPVSINDLFIPRQLLIHLAQRPGLIAKTLGRAAAKGGALPFSEIVELAL